MTPKSPDSPLYRLVRQCWAPLARDFFSTRVTTDDMVLYVAWSLDSLKENETTFAEQMWDSLLSQLRDDNIYNGLNLSLPDAERLVSVICAITLLCVGATFTTPDSLQPLYRQMLRGIQAHWIEVNAIDREFSYGDLKADLQQWMSTYWNALHYYTFSDCFAWADTPAAPRLTARDHATTHISVNRPTNCTFIENQITE